MRKTQVVVMERNYDWGSLGKAKKGSKPRKKRATPYDDGGKKKRKHKYKGAYNTSALEDLLSTRGESNGKLLALQRGKTLITKSSNDAMRAQTTTAKTFNGIDILDNLITYDRNVVKEPDNLSLSAQFGNYQASTVPDNPALANKGIITYRPCPF